jgi:uroporphyrinogen decarboxylase
LSSEARRAKEEEEREGVPVTLFVNGCGHLLEAMAESGADMLSVDWRVSLAEARRRVPRLALQGNLDPGILLGPAEEVARRTRDIVAETGGQAHVVNLGHGVLPETPIDSAQAFFDAARETPAAAVAVEAEARA